MYKICRSEKSFARQRELEEGFLEYLEIVPFAEMEITELCRHINVPRKTFYRYFGCKEDALFALVDHRLEDMDRFMEQYAPGTSRTLRQDAVYFFSFWKEQHKFLEVLSRNYLISVLLDRSVLQSKVMIRYREYDSHGKDSARGYMLNFMVSGMMSMMIQWYHSGYKKSVDELADITAVLINKPIIDILDYSN